MAAAVCQLTRSRCRGCLLGALLGDCLGGNFEARESVSAAELLRFVLALGPLPSPTRQGPAAELGEESGGEGKTEEGGRASKILYYSDDTAMAHSVVRSLLTKKHFDEVDMAKRFAEEYDKDPDRSYGGGVVAVFKKLLSPKCRDVFEPARQQFNGKGSYGNGGAMRVAGISLAYSDIQDVKKFAKLSAELTHANSLGYNGAILQALAVHYALRGESNRDKFLDQLIGQMEDVEADDKSVADAQMLGYEDRPFSKRLKKIREFLKEGTVSKSDVLLELDMENERFFVVTILLIILYLLFGLWKLLRFCKRRWERVSPEPPVEDVEVRVIYVAPYIPDPSRSRISLVQEEDASPASLPSVRLPYVCLPSASLSSSLPSTSLPSSLPSNSLTSGIPPPATSDNAMVGSDDSDHCIVELGAAGVGGFWDGEQQ